MLWWGGPAQHPSLFMSKPANRSSLLMGQCPYLSIIVITLNEAANINSLIESLPPHDELIMVDSGSTDATVAFAEAAGARVVVHADWQGFGVQKNRALELATGDWVLSLDADERVSEALRHEIAHVLSEPKHAVYEIPRKTQFCGQWIQHCGWTPDFVPRLFKRGSAAFNSELVHEKLIPVDRATVGRLKSHLLHYSYPTPDRLWAKLSRYSMDWAVQRFERGIRYGLWRAFASFFLTFIKTFFFRLGFLDGRVGLIVCMMQAQSAYAKYVHLFMLHETAKNDRAN
jgi:glycosyltransferase involved in cell wall biosynthesis